MILSLANALALYVSASYVLALYLSSKDVNEFKIRRDDPRVIMSRMKAVISVNILNIIGITTFLSFHSKKPWFHCFLELGIIPGCYTSPDLTIWDGNQYLYDMLRQLKLIMILFAGPVIDNLLYYIVMPSASVWDILKDLRNEIFNIWGLRNYIFGPATEELTYTSMILTIYLQLWTPSELSMKHILVTAPCFFGLAHVHHAFELYLGGMYSTLQIVFNTIFQMSYTMIFGSFTNYLYLKSGGNLWSCILIHAFCNYMGFPQGSSLVQEYSILPQSSKSTLRTLICKLWRYSYVPTLLIGILCFKDSLLDLAVGSYGSLL